MEELQKAYYAIIPANVRYDKSLKPNAKLLYGEITALCNAQGYCWASNDYFASLYNVSKTTISRWISQLVKSEYLQLQLILKENTKEIKERRLFLPQVNYNHPIDEKDKGYGQKSQGGHDKKVNTPIDEKSKDNNTLLNNTFNITLDIINSITQKWNELNLGQIRSLKPTTTRYKNLKARITEYSQDEVEEAIENIKKSDFLKGDNDRNWVITFDWFVKPNNFCKVLEGNYTSKGQEVKKNNDGNRGNNKSNETEWEKAELEKARELAAKGKSNEQLDF